MCKFLPLGQTVVWVGLSVVPTHRAVGPRAVTWQTGEGGVSVSGWTSTLGTHQLPRVADTEITVDAEMFSMIYVQDKMEKLRNEPNEYLLFLKILTEMKKLVSFVIKIDSLSLSL